MRSIFILIVTLLLPLSYDAAAGSPESATFANADLGFSLSPPPGLQDLTALLREIEHRQENDGRQWFAPLLFVASGRNNTAADWVSLAIMTYPRGRDKDPGDDVTASFITNDAAGFGKTKEQLVVKLSGFDFAMSRFEASGLFVVKYRSSVVAKYSIGFTTVRNEQFLTFIFAGNDSDKVEKLAAASMNTLKFVKPRAS